MAQTDDKISTVLASTLAALEKIGAAWRDAHAQERELAAERNRLILRASELGAPRRRVAAAAGVTNPRVQQVLNDAHRQRP